MISRKGLLAAFTCAVLLAACGGGGGGGGNDQVDGGHVPGTPLPTGTQLYGMAATGAAMQNAAIEIKDKVGLVRTKTANPDGTFLLDVTGLTFPAMIRATSFDGKTTAYGLVFESDLNKQIAITPLSSLVVTNALNTNPASFYAAFGSSTPTITEEAIASSATGIYDALAPVMAELGVSLTINEFFSGFVADHTGIDLVIDALTVEIVGTRAVIKDKFGTTIADTDLAIVDSFAVTVSDDLVEGANAAPLVTDALNAISTHCHSLPITEDCTTLFPVTFKHAGISDPAEWAAWYHAWFESDSSGELPIIPYVVTYKLLSIDGKDENGYLASYSINIFNDGKISTLKDQGYFKKNESGAVDFYGDGENMWLDLTLDVANNALYLKARSKVAPPNFGYVLWTGSGMPANVKSRIVTGRWPDSFNNYVSQTCIRLTSRGATPSPGCTVQRFDDVTYPVGTYLLLNYQAYDRDDQPIAGYGGIQWIELK